MILARVMEWLFHPSDASSITQEMQHHKKMGSQFYVMMAVVALFCSGQYYIFSYQTRLEEQSTIMMNTLGKQRMMAQRIAALAALYAQPPTKEFAIPYDTLSALVEDFENAHNKIISTQEDPSHTLHSDALYALYFNAPTLLDIQVKSFIDHARAVQVHTTANYKINLNHVLYLREQADGALASALEKAVQQFQHDTDTRLHNYLYLSRGVLVLCFALLILVARFIFHPAISSIRDTLGLMQLLRKVAIAANQSHKIEEGIGTAIRAVCDYTGWQVGHAYVYSEEKKALVHLDVWTLPEDNAYTPFRATSEAMQFEPGQGFIGEVYKDATPMWILDVAHSNIYLRKNTAMEAGIKTAFAFPITVGRKSVAVMEFYSNEAKIPDQTLLSMMASIGTQLGQVIERSRAQERAQLLETVITSASEAIIITKADLDEPGPEIIYVNPAFTDMTGYAPEEVIGKSPRMLQGPDTDKNALAHIKSQLMQGTPYRGEIINYGKSGAPYWVGVSIMPIRNHEGVITHYAALERDITERKQSEDQLAETLRQLKRANLKAEAVARDLEVSLQLAEEANRAKSDFLANMSHELRTPMNGVLGMAHLLSDTSLESEQRDYVNTINGSAETLLMLLNDILDFSKIEAGALVLERMAFNLPDMLHETVNLIKPQAQKKSIALELDIDDYIPHYLWGDSGRLRQIITNLIGNSVKFTPSGYVRLSIKQHEADSIPMLYLAIEDTGIGIAEDKLASIFEKFTQADTSVTRKFGGTGLGLAITRQLVQMMGGEIGVESAEGKGSTFWFTLPLNEAQEEDCEQFATQTISTRHQDVTLMPVETAHILLVEDYPVNQMFALKLLSKFGFTQIDLAENGQQAIERFQHYKYDAIFMDCQMPELDGYQTTEHIRTLEKESGHHTPIIAMTANAMIGDREKCLQSGMDDYVSKPLKPERLQLILQQYFILPEHVTNAGSVPTSQKSATLPPVDMDHLRSFTSGGVEEERELMDMFLTQAQDVVDRLHTLTTEDQKLEWKSYSHLLKGSSGNFGAMTLHHIAKRAEAQFEAQENKKQQMLAEIEKELSRVAEFCATV